MNPCQLVNCAGQQIWLDFLSRSLLQEGQLQHYIDTFGISGVTTNPSIFSQAIQTDPSYQQAILNLQQKKLSHQQIYEALVVEDVQNACDLFLPLYQSSHSKQGYVSLEVSPEYADNVQQTVEEALRLNQTVNRPNLLIKIPATHAGIQASEQLIYQGLNINMTLIFTLEQLHAIHLAYQQGLLKRHQEGKPLAQIFSVTSFFLSRIDTHLDPLLKAQNKLNNLIGNIALCLAKQAYQNYQHFFNHQEFEPLRQANAQPQYLLWASTRTKNPDYSDLLYVEPLIGKNTINTMPQETLTALLRHGNIQANSLEINIEQQRHLNRLIEAGISLHQIGQNLLQQGLLQFKQAYRTLLEQF